MSQQQYNCAKVDNFSTVSLSLTAIMVVLMEIDFQSYFCLEGYLSNGLFSYGRLLDVVFESSQHL
jgi:hypothetical protein